MSQPLIILGAGASHDFANPTTLGFDEDRHKFIFPLTDHLIDGKFVNRDIQARYEAVKTLFSRIVACAKKNSLEECLEGWTDHEQLIALRFYLGEYFWEKSNENIVKDTPGNFRALVDYVKKSSAKGAYIVTFNYDVLLENELGLDKFVEISDYINGSVENIRIIKIHGSCDWFYIIGHLSKNAYSELIQNPEILKGRHLQINTKRMVKLLGNQVTSSQLVPVISVPVSSAKVYACPDDHISELVVALKDIQKILIIGWKAGDSFLLEKLREIKKPIALTIVSGTEEGAKKIAEIVKKYIPTRIFQETLFGGFSDFIGSKECDEFFNETL